MTSCCGKIAATAWAGTFSSALRELYLRSEHDDLRPTEEEIYGTFLKHTPPGLEDEFRDLYRRLHGGPFVDAEN